MKGITKSSVYIGINISFSYNMIIIICFSALHIFADNKLYVFYPTLARPQAVQEILQQSLSGVSVTVFGRYNDFSEKVSTDQPEAVLAKPEIIKQLGNYSIALNGVRNGKTNNTYVLISVKEPIDLKNINSETIIGTIDILGKTGTENFIRDIFPEISKIKRVNKVEDLLPLLTFNMVSAVIIEEVFVKYFRSTSHLELGISPIPEVKSGIIAVGVRKESDIANELKTLKKHDRETGALFEIEGWK